MRLRYFGIGKESEFGTAVAPVFYVDQASASLDTPDSPSKIKKGSLTRFPREHRPGAYNPDGSVDFVADAPLLWYFLWLIMGGRTDTDNTKAVSSPEGIGETAAGKTTLAGTLANVPVIPGSISIHGMAGDISDDGFGKLIQQIDVSGEEFATTEGQTTKEVVLAHTDIVPGSVVIRVTNVNKATDDANGNIVPISPATVTGTVDYDAKGGAVLNLTGLVASTTYSVDYSYKTAVSGKLDYSTGAFTLRNVDAETEYTADYTYGTYQHNLTISDEKEMLSATFRLGKDTFEHVFTGCSIKTMKITASNDWIIVSIDVLAKVDGSDVVRTLPDIRIPQGYPAQFNNIVVKKSDYGATPAEDATVEKLTLTISSGAVPKMTLGSRFARYHKAGEFSVSADMTLEFEDDTALNEFWGNDGGPSESSDVKEKAYQFVINGSALGTVTLDIPRAEIKSLKTKQSGKDEIKQDLTVEALYDNESETLMSAVCTSVYNY
jgi:hypothetical protein